MELRSISILRPAFRLLDKVDPLILGAATAIGGVASIFLFVHHHPVIATPLALASVITTVDAIWGAANAAFPDATPTKRKCPSGYDLN